MSRAQTLQPENRIAHYRIVGPLGSGGMGEVYVAEDERLERRVALKILPADLVSREDRVRRFIQEAKSASSLNHPSIVTIYEIGEDRVRAGEAEPLSGPVRFISMELIRGKTLASHIHEERTELRTLLGWAAQAAEGVAKAHAAGIVHRDLKPSNIMVSDDGFAKVLDFGLAKLTEKESDPDLSTAPTQALEHTTEGAVLGTVGYMSPEQVQGKRVDHRSDLFSFGCILYEIATRRRPFAAESHVETLHRILHDQPVPVEDTHPAIPAELRRLIRRCLAKSPDQRHQSMKDLALDLREIVDEFPALAAASTSASGRAPFVDARPRGIPWKPAAVVGSALVLAVVAGWAIQRGRPERDAEPFQTMRVSTQTHRGDVQKAAISPDGRYLVYIPFAGEKYSLRVRQIATGSDVEILPPLQEELGNPSFSPDGNYVFYTMRKPDARQYFALFQVPSLGGTPRERAFDVDSRASFSPDGQHICFLRGEPDAGRSTLVVRELDSGSERVVATAPFSVRMSPPDWSPDGRRIATALADPVSDRSQVMIHEASGGRSQQLVTLDRWSVTDLAWTRDGRSIVILQSSPDAALAQQIGLVDYPAGRHRRVTNDANAYVGLTVSSGDAAIATVRQSTIANLWLLDTRGGAPRRITSATSSDNSIGSFAVTSNDHTAFLTHRDGKAVLFVQDFAGGAAQPMDLRGGIPTILVAGGGVLLVGILREGRMTTWRASPDGSATRPVSERAGEYPVDVSPDGRHAVLARADSSRGAWIVSTETGTIERVVPEAHVGLAFILPGGKVISPKLETSPQGRIEGVYQLFDLGTGALLARRNHPPTALPPSPGRIGWNPRSEALGLVDASGPGMNVFEHSLAGPTARQVTRFTDGLTKFFAWSPDGSVLAIVRSVRGVDNLWVVGASGVAPRQITSFVSEQILRPPVWTPDGRRVVVSAGPQNQDAVLIRDFQ